MFLLLVSCTWDSSVPAWVCWCCGTRIDLLPCTQANTIRTDLFYVFVDVLVRICVLHTKFHARNFFGEFPILYVNFDPCIARSRLVLSRLVSFCFVLLCLVWSCLVRSCFLLLSTFVLSHFIVSCLLASWCAPWIHDTIERIKDNNGREQDKALSEPPNHILDFVI